MLQHSVQALGAAPLELVKPRSLLTPRRLDLAVKWRFFRYLANGKDREDSERLYRWHIKSRRKANRRVGVGMDTGKSGTEQYVYDATVLFRSMWRNGFDYRYSIPIDPDGELLDGAHRTACALALGIDCYVQHMPQKVWAPAWDRQWFIDNGMSEEDLSRALADWNTMLNE